MEEGALCKDRGRPRSSTSRRKAGKEEKQQAEKWIRRDCPILGHREKRGKGGPERV
jgi:hypothetical protein